MAESCGNMQEQTALTLTCAKPLSVLENSAATVADGFCSLHFAVAKCGNSRTLSNYSHYWVHGTAFQVAMITKTIPIPATRNVQKEIILTSFRSRQMFEFSLCNNLQHLFFCIKKNPKLSYKRCRNDNVFHGRRKEGRRYKGWGAKVWPRFSH